MQLFKTLFGLFIFFFLGLIIIGIFYPKDSFIISKLNTESSADCIYDNLIDFKKWNDWNMCHQYDNNMKIEYFGNKGDIGSGYTWKGSGRVGEGKITIIDIKEKKNVKYSIEMHSESPIISEINIEKNNLTWSIPIDYSDNKIIKFLFGGLHNIIFTHLVKKELDKSLEALNNLCK